MIYTHKVSQLQCMSKAFYPPWIPIFFVDFPTVERIPPKLSGLAEVVRWHTGNGRWAAMFVQFEQFLMRPYVGTLIGHKYRDISNDFNSALVCIMPQI